MKYRKLGKTGLKVSAICLGTMTFGNQVNEKEAASMIEKALSAGINFIDTANVYAEGLSEGIVGKALGQHRHSVVLATKVGMRTGPGENDSGLSRKYIMTAVENSLLRLQTDYIDIYYVHSPDYDTPIEETLRALDDLVHQGKILHIACSNFSAWQLCRALWASNVHGLARFECIQPPYNLITRDIEYELLPLCSAEKVGVCVYNPLAGGLLTGKHDPNRPPSEGTRFALESMATTYYKRYWSSNNFDAVTQLKRIAGIHGRSLTQLSLAWVLNNEIVTSVICGATSLDQLAENLGAMEVHLSDDEIESCNKVWEQFRPTRFFYGR